MSFNSWDSIVQIAALVVALIVGAGGTVPIVNWLKSTLNLSGRAAQVLALVVSLLLATATAIVQGIISPETMTPEAYATIALAVLTASQVEYSRYKQKELSRAIEAKGENDAPET